MDTQQGLCILTVGDEPALAESVRESTPTEGGRVRVESVTTASDGLAELAAGDVDCVVSAYDLPEQTGIEFLEAVRERSGDTPFVLFSAEGDERVASEAVSAGVTEYAPSAACVEQPGLLFDRIQSATERARDGPRQHPRHGRRFEAVFEDSQRLVAVLAPDGTVRDVNQTAIECTGADREAVTDVPFWETPWWDDGARPDVRRWVDTAAGGEHVTYDTERARFGDSTGSADGELIPVTDNDGTVSELVVIARAPAERELAKTREQLSLALDAADAAVWEADLETGELYWDDQAQALWGYEPGEFDGTFEEFREPVHPDDWDRLETAYQTAIETRGEYTVEIRVRPDGDPMRWVEVAGQVIADETGAPRRLVGLSTDVTERKEREQTLERQNDRLDEFANVVSHDLRNPLNVAQARATMLHEQCGDEADEHSVPLVNALDRMENIIEDTLTLAREARTVGERDAVQIPDIVGRCWASVETGEATLDVEDEFVVRGDDDRLRHVFENLFRNAVEHGDDGVTVRVGRTGEDRLYVEDNGPGIPVDRRDEVFEPGYTSTSEGTGFGLPIVKRIAEAHGWAVTVTDGRDGGARFEFVTAGPADA
ncbi:MAG: ATP-binding protein [Haloferacaceae archaeon]